MFFAVIAAWAMGIKAPTAVVSAAGKLRHYLLKMNSLTFHHVADDAGMWYRLPRNGEKDVE